MKTVKVFTYSSLPEDLSAVIFEMALSELGGSGIDNPYKYRIGYLTEDYENSTPEEKIKHFNQKDILLDKQIVNWFETQGVKLGETVYFER